MSDIIYATRIACLNCARKHLAQAAILRDEMFMGYPEHMELSFDHMDSAEGEIRDRLLKYWRSMGHMAEASDETIGKYYDLANAIRDERLKFQEDPNYKPLFDKLICDATVLAGNKEDDDADSRKSQ